MTRVNTGSGATGQVWARRDPRFAYAVVAMLAGPSVTGVVLTALVYGRAGLRGLLSRLLTWRAGGSWCIALLTAPVLMIGTLLALSFTSPAFLPGIVTSEDKGLGI